MNNNRWEQARRYSHVGISSGCNFTYASQYQRAYEILYNSDDSVDTLALPMLYSLRHYLELALKYNINYFSDYSLSTSMVAKSGHRLLPLSKAFTDHWILVKKRYDIEIDDVELQASLKDLVDEFEDLDKMGMNFRYSHDLKANASFDRLIEIDIYSLHRQYQNVKLLLDHSIDVFESMTGLMHGTIDKKTLLRQAT